MPIKYYTDVHIHKAVVAQLRQRGVDIIHCEEVGMALADDPEHLEYAATTERSMVSNDRDFIHWHNEWLQQGKNHAGIFLVVGNKDDIGMVVRELLFWHDAIIGNAGTLEADVFNQIFFVS